MHPLISQPSLMGVETGKPSVSKVKDVAQVMPADALLVLQKYQKSEADVGSNFQHIFDAEGEKQISDAIASDLIKPAETAKADKEPLPTNVEALSEAPKAKAIDGTQEEVPHPDDATRMSIPLDQIDTGRTMPRNVDTTPKKQTDPVVHSERLGLETSDFALVSIMTTKNDSSPVVSEPQQPQRPNTASLQHPIVPHHFGWASSVRLIGGLFQDWRF